MTVSPRKALGFSRYLVGGELAMVSLWPQPRVVTSCHERAGHAHWPGPAKGLAMDLASWDGPKGPPVAVGYGEA
jgi:hypothetical protein